MSSEANHPLNVNGRTPPRLNSNTSRVLGSLRFEAEQVRSSARSRRFVSACCNAQSFAGFTHFTHFFPPSFPAFYIDEQPPRSRLYSHIATLTLADAATHQPVSRRGIIVRRHGVPRIR